MINNLYVYSNFTILYVRGIVLLLIIFREYLARAVNLQNRLLTQVPGCTARTHKSSSIVGKGGDAMVPGKMRFKNNDPVADDNKKRQSWPIPSGRQMDSSKGHNRHLFCFKLPLLCFDHRACFPFYCRILMS